MKEGKMETAWIQVFVLTLTQCIAPAGKMVCQEEAVEYLFTNENDCASALVTMVDLAARAEDIIVDRQKSNCKPAAKESIVFADSVAAKASLANSDDFVLIDGKEPPADFMQAAHNERLENLKSCEESNGVAPCKIGAIIVESADDGVKTEVWQRQK
jgi:hypothetical protein